MALRTQTSEYSPGVRGQRFRCFTQGPRFRTRLDAYGIGGTRVSAKCAAKSLGYIDSVLNGQRLDIEVRFRTLLRHRTTTRRRWSSRERTRSSPSFVAQLLPVEAAQLHARAKGAQLVDGALGLRPLRLPRGYEPSDRDAASGDEHVLSLRDRSKDRCVFASNAPILIMALVLIQLVH